MKVTFVYRDTPRKGELVEFKQNKYGQPQAVVVEDGLDYPMTFFMDEMQDLLTAHEPEFAISDNELMELLRKAAKYETERRSGVKFRNPLFLLLVALWKLGGNNDEIRRQVQEALDGFRELMR